jgi:hypothetical protein
MNKALKDVVIGIISGIALIHVISTIFVLLSIVFFFGFIVHGNLFLGIFYMLSIAISAVIIIKSKSTLFKQAFIGATLVSLIIFTIKIAVPIVTTMSTA